MRIKIGYLTPLLASAGVCASVVLAPAAAAVPECTNTGPTTTQCQTGGSTQIVTSPPAMNYWNNYPWFGWGFGGFVIGIG